MKKPTWLLAFVLLTLLLALTGCGEDPGVDVTIIANSATQYNFIYGTASYPDVRWSAGDIFDLCYSKCGVNLNMKSYDKVEMTDYEIIYGRTDRQISIDLADAIDAYPADSLVWGIACDGTRVAIYANSALAFTEYGKMAIAESYFADGNFVVKDNLWRIEEVTAAEYQLVLDARAAEEAAKEAEKHQAAVERIKAEVAKTVYDFGKLPEFPETYGVPEIHPVKGQHPRVWVTEDKLERITKNLDCEENAVVYEKVLARSDISYNGILPVPTDKTYNFSTAGLANIESLAFMYLVTGKEEYAYAAIRATKNYLDTLVVTDDLSNKRYYVGCAMYVFAEVYDWCYDILTDRDKEEIVLGVVNVLGPEFEIGVPPKGQGAVSGHGTGAQLLKNWMAFSIAVYDEYPQIYNNVVGRFFEQYIDAPNFYYKSGTNFTGSSYGTDKTCYTMISQMLIEIMSGKNIYDVEFETTAITFVNHIRPDNQAIRIGDDYLQQGETYNLYRYGNLTFFGYVMYDNPALKAWSYELTNGFADFTWTGEFVVTPVTFLILNKPWIEFTPDDKYDLPTVNVNGSPSGQVIARSAWPDEDGSREDEWVTYTKIGEAYGNDHEHKDAGTFQIYYKGILAMNSSCYEYNGQYYGSVLDAGYGKQTISKNGLLIYNPNLSDNGLFLYSGGQRIHDDETGTANAASSTLEGWLKRTTSRQAKILGTDYAIAGDGTTEFAYMSGDITNAYDTATVDSVTRATISIATGNEAHPLLFMVYDRITADDPAYKKTFLLHTPEEPTVNGNVVTITNTAGDHNGKLTSTTLLPEASTLEVIGGDGKRFWVNGKNVYDELPPEEVGIKEAGWGRIEVSPSAANATDSFLHVMYVGDADKDDAYIPSTLIKSDTHEGAMSMGSVVMFTKSAKATSDAVSFTTEGEGEYSYYVNGLTSGKWSVTVDGKAVATVTVKEGSDLAAFTAAAGAVKLTMVK